MVKCGSLMIFKFVILFQINFVFIICNKYGSGGGGLHEQQLGSRATSKVITLGTRVGDSIVLPCGVNKNVIPHDENGHINVPVLVNWFRHYSLHRKSERPIYAKYLAHSIDYDPHIERDYENRINLVDQINLNITNLKTIDEGIYECKLVFFDKAYDNNNGSMVHLQIYVPPEFENLSDEIYYLKNNMPIRLYCYAKGKPTPTVTWYKKDANTNAWTRIGVNSSLLYEAPSEYFNENLIEYKCKAENLMGEIEYSIKVIRSGSLIFAEPLKNQTILEGTLLNWPCLAQSNTEITYKWYKDSIAVQTILRRWSERGALFQDGMLYLSETTREDSGLYECHAYTSSKRIQTSAYLNVIYPPEIIDFPTHVYTQEGSQLLVVDCHTQANPAVHIYEWFKEDNLLLNSHKYNILPNGSLVIRNLVKHDHGEYYCTAQNTLKKAISNKVNIEIIDTKKVDNLHYASLEQTSYKLNCKLQKSKTHQWFKLNSKLPTERYKVEENGQLILYNLKKSDSGVYLCVNDFDLTENNYQLIRLIIVENTTAKNIIEANSNNPKLHSSSDIVDTLPSAPENIRINQTIDIGILISWSYPEQTKVKIEYYQLFYRHYNNKTENYQGNEFSDWISSDKIPSTETKYLLKTDDLIENEFYQFQINSYSIYSQSLPTEIFTFQYITPDNNDPLIRSPYSWPSLSLPTPSNTTFFKSFSQLDVILITVFLVSLFILSVTVILCIVYYRSNKLRKHRHSENVKDLDDWGFQSSAVTATFLSTSSSSTPSSEKSSQLLSSNIDSKTNTTLDCDLNKETNKLIKCTKRPNNNDNNNNNNNNCNSTVIRYNSKVLYQNIIENNNTKQQTFDDLSTTTTSANTIQSTSRISSDNNSKQPKYLLKRPLPPHDYDYATWLNKTSSNSTQIESTSTCSSCSSVVKYNNQIMSEQHHCADASIDNGSSACLKCNPDCQIYPHLTSDNMEKANLLQFENKIALLKYKDGCLNDDNIYSMPSNVKEIENAKVTDNEIYSRVQSKYNTLKVDYV